MQDTAHFQRFGDDFLPGHLGIEIVEVSAERVRASLPIRRMLLAPNGFLHAGTRGHAGRHLRRLRLRPGLAARRVGLHDDRAQVQPSRHSARRRDRLRRHTAHLGRTTQVWDATVTHRDSGKTIALFRCTQMVLYPK